MRYIPSGMGFQPIRVAPGLSAVFFALIAVLWPGNSHLGTADFWPNAHPTPQTAITLATTLAPTVATIGRPASRSALRAPRYDLQAVRARAADVPRVFLPAIPSGLGDLTVAERKARFIRTLLPLVLRENERIAATRMRLLSFAYLLDRQGGGRADSKPAVYPGWIDALATRHGLGKVDMAELIKRVDVIPPSLAIAQAAVESGWGTSRFAQVGNALFGQWTFSKGAGMVPRGRDPGQTHEIKIYETPGQSIAAYMHNLNSHRAYRELRSARLELRRGGGLPSGAILAAALGRYSQRGAAYVEDLHRIIRVNDLEAMDEAGLARPRRAFAAGGSE